MEVMVHPTDSKSEPSPSTKVVGIVENRHQLKAITDEWAQLGLQGFDVFEGPEGAKLFGAEDNEARQNVLGEMEAEMARRYLYAVNNGQIIFAIAVEPAVANKISEMAQSHGAFELVHFGPFVVRK